MATDKTPKTLQEAIIFFSDPDNCLNYLAVRRWPDGVTCPTCGRDDVTFLAKQRKWQCKSAHRQRQFSVKVGTIFEDSPIGLDKWLPAVWQVVNCKNGISSYEMAKAFGVTQKTAWFMDHRIRLAMQSGSFLKKMQGHVEVDETFIGGLARNMHETKKKHLGTGGAGKVAVMGLLDRHSREVRCQVVPNVRTGSLDRTVRQHVESGSVVYSDAFKSYNKLEDEYIHNVINHAERYVDGQVHTNGIENFWSLLKRSIKGTYVSVEPFHLFRYLDEQTYRFNSRRGTDGERFERVMEQVSGKRLTYAEVTGKGKAAEKLSH
ncbi:MAG TPA: IS1595 family transposase [Pyrinomonadaceae bacterium]|jgi:transposase-like protein|nr:IS1595 family transposase [Pyrinomonadaceae bacterium]